MTPLKAVRTLLLPPMSVLNGTSDGGLRNMGFHTCRGATSAIRRLILWTTLVAALLAFLVPEVYAQEPTQAEPSSETETQSEAQAESSETDTSEEATPPEPAATETKAAEKKPEAKTETKAPAPAVSYTPVIDTAAEKKAADDKAKKYDRRVEKLEVTGSHIKRIDVEGPSPVVVLDREHLERSGYNSVADVLRESTTNSFGSAREASGSNAAGVASVSLRGLGASRTLVLLNGKRLPSDAVTGAVDLNLIPMAAVERIDILKDGASATYGSDALGGVVNIITRKDYNGTEISARQHVPEMKGGEKTEVNLVTGSSSAESSLVTTIHYRQNKKIFARDREWSAEGTSTLGSPGSYRQVNGDNTKENWQADSNCPAGQIRTTPGGDFCTFRYADFATSLPNLEQLSALTDFTYEFNDQYTFFGRVNATRKRASWIYAPSPGIFKVPSAVADTLGPGGTPLPGVTPGSDVEIRYRLVELGNRVSEIETTAFGILAGFKGQLFNTWDWELSSHTNRVNRTDFGVSGYAVEADLDNLIATGAFNPMAPAGSRGSLDSAFYKPWQVSNSEISATELKASGELFDIWGGALALGVGGIFSHESYQDIFDPLSVQGKIFGNAGSSGGGERDTESGYIELSAPLTSNLELQLAGRHDKFSDFGETTNPKAAIRWQASKSLMFRASTGTGFKAPAMQDLYASTSEGYPSFIDHVACEAEKTAGGATPSCAPQQYLRVSGGNPDLKEETSTSVNVGMVYQPSQMFSFGMDWWQINLDNVVGLSLEDATKAELAGANLADHGVVIVRDSNGYIEEVTAPLLNLSKQEISGLDIATEMRYRGKAGLLGLKIEHGLVFAYKQEGFPGTGFLDILGERGLPPWRNTATLSYAPNLNNEMSLVARTVAGTDKTVKEEGKLKDYTEFDFQYNYTAPWDGTLTVGIKNLAGSTPPLDDSDPNNQLDGSLFDAIGKTAYVGYKQNL